MIPPVVNPLDQGIRRLDVQILYVRDTDRELLVLEQPLILGGHVPLVHDGVALELADELGGVWLDVEVAVADLAIVVLPHGVVALADVLPLEGLDALPALVVGFDSRLYLVPRDPPDREQRLVELDVLATRLLQLFEILV